jgi:septal ring factor EnvC (AmiA/AmiB activator)
VTDPTLPPGVPGAAAANAGRPPGPVPPGAAAAAGGTSSEQMAMMMQRLASSEDDRKALAGRLQQLETQLREKDQAVVQTSYEVQESTKQMKRTRDDLARWKQDMDGLRTKLASIERENKLTLEAILKTLEQYIDREKDDKK